MSGKKCANSEPLISNTNSLPADDGDTELLNSSKADKVLLVDDDPRNLFALSTVLKKRGYELIVAESGSQALNALETQQDFDLVLMDIMMYEMDGYEAIRRIREYECFLNLPIIALTANAMAGDRDKCLQAGANDYLSKPVNSKELLKKMQELLS